MPLIRIERAEVELETRFTPRLWTLFHDVPVLYEALLRELAHEGLGPSDIRSETGDGSLGGFSVGFWLLGIRSKVSIQLDKLRFSCSDLPALRDRTRLVGAVDRLFAALGSTCAPEAMEFTNHTVWYNCHAAIEGGPAQQYINQFVGTVPSREKIGAHLGSGVAFYFGRNDRVTNSTLTLEGSAILTDGLFIRMTAILPGTVSRADELTRLTQEQLYDLLEAAGLQVEAGA